ncbi:hypothetical protein [Streptomyces gibsoniae]|uniref:Transposase IS4-like domain-containing protein n=1 Tax=Streptomyces gibsoniae TaxID=3075529 RepID=A0ABU2UA12_9ACTN|nr:hypothetical protein [Streptomyces sp. DSM 41699]MDT0469995.1 hypothetical protein [Streptomyces sp. DSM 41699]
MVTASSWLSPAPTVAIRELAPDGSYLTRLTDPADSHRQANKRGRRRKAGQAPPAPLAPRGPVVRVVEAVITVRTGDGTVRTGHYRLITTLLDPQLAPARELAATYARRRAADTGFREIKTFLRGSHRALRATDPEVARQELWAYLIVYQGDPPDHLPGRPTRGEPRAREDLVHCGPRRSPALNHYHAPGH